jgi:6-phosphogluconolactonase
MTIRTVTSSAHGISIAVEAIAAGVRSAWLAHRDAHVVISGGRSGKALGMALAAEFGDFRGGFVHVWIADERYVDYSDPNRNDSSIIAALPQGDPNLHVHRYLPPAMTDVVSAAEAYAKELETALGERPFDAVVLSVGEDGHVASVFPGHAQQSELAYVEFDSPKPPAVRTTLSLARLANTRNCVVLALGESKAAAVRGFAAGDGTLPALQLANLTNVTLVTDAISGISAGVPAVDSVY